MCDHYLQQAWQDNGNSYAICMQKKWHNLHIL